MHVLGYRVPLIALVGAVVGLGVGVALAIRRRQSGSPALRCLAAMVSAACWGLVLGLLLAPSDTSGNTTGCGGLRSLTDLWDDQQRLLNVGLFAVLAGSTWWAVPSGRRTIVTFAVIVTPFVAEFAQEGFLGRACDLTDIADNLIGAVVGFVVAAASASVVEQDRDAGKAADSTHIDQHLS